MAGEADELDTEQNEALEIEEEQQAGPAEVVLDGEDEAQAGAEDPNESAVIRDFRRREREKDRELRELRQRVEQAAAPALPSDPGPRPTLEAFEFDDDKYGEALDKWIEDKAAHETAVREQTQRAQQVEQARRQAYQSAKAAQPIEGIDEAEKRVFDQVPELMRNALLHARSPAVVAALDKYPDRLNAIADTFRTDPAEALMMIGELRGKAKIMPRNRPAPPPEEIERGSGAIRHAGADKQLEKLEKKAAATGDRTELIAYKKQLRERGK